jgi:hypothetical protein
MKMAKSSTKNELPLAELKAAVRATALYLSQWTEHQVQQLSINNRTPYIWPIDNVGYIIGHYRILNDKGSWQVRNYDNKLLHSFTEKLGAVFYALCILTKRYVLADNLKLADETVGRLRNDIVHYESSIKRAKTAKKYDSADIWTARLFDARLHLQYANNELQKSLSHAKYIKYWE